MLDGGILSEDDGLGEVGLGGSGLIIGGLFLGGLIVKIGGF